MEKDTILVVTGEPLTRGANISKINVDELNININLFLEQMDNMLEKTPKKVGKFKFVEFEVHAEITAKGTLAILGTGGEVGVTGGLKFVFRREVN